MTAALARPTALKEARSVNGGSKTSLPAGEISIASCEDVMYVAINSGNVKPAPCPLVHNFFPGLYARQITIPARTLVTSRTHKTTHPFVILAGDISVRDDAGNVERLRAGHFGVTSPGTKRMLYAHEDTIWVTFHPTEETDPDVIAGQILEPEDALRFSRPELAQVWKHNPERDSIRRFGVAQQLEQ